jgi:glycosyltransferase involved in cell wall biosynthesis
LAFEWIATQIDKDKYALDFILINSEETDLEVFLNKNGNNTVRFISKGKLSWPKVWLQIFWYLRKRKPQIVHCHLFQASFLGLLAAKFAGIPKRIYTRHHSDYHFRYFPKGVKWDKFINSLATLIVAPSKAVVHVLRDLESVPPNKVVLVNHGFDLDYFENVPSDLAASIKCKYNLENKRPVVGVISRFTELKGIQYIIPAFKSFLNEYPNALLLLFNAKGDYEKQIELLLGELPSGSYKTIPFEPQLSGVYSLFDCFLQVSTDTNIEAFGQTYVEALAAGVPSIFTLSGVANEFIVDKKNALVVRFENETDILDALTTCANNATLREQIIENGKQSVKELFSIQKMISSLEMLYSS